MALNDTPLPGQILIVIESHIRCKEFITKMRLGKSGGPNHIPFELWKCVGVWEERELFS